MMQYRVEDYRNEQTKRGNVEIRRKHTKNTIECDEHVAFLATPTANEFISDETVSRTQEMVREANLYHQRQEVEHGTH